MSIAPQTRRNEAESGVRRMSRTFMKSDLLHERMKNPLNFQGVFGGSPTRKKDGTIGGEAAFEQVGSDGVRML